MGHKQTDRHEEAIFIVMCGGVNVMCTLTQGIDILVPNIVLASHGLGPPFVKTVRTFDRLVGFVKLAPFIPFR